MKSQYVFGIHSVLSLLTHSPKRIKHLFLLQHRHDARIQEIEQLAQQQHIAITHIDRVKLDEMSAQENHQGVVAECIAAQNYSEQDILDLIAGKTAPIILILDGVQDPHNLGACLRSAAAAGVNLVLVPKDNAVGLTATAQKVASGAAEIVPFIQVTNLARTLRELKAQGVWVYGADGEATKTIDNIDFAGPVAIVLGAEGRGLRRLTRELCDELMAIPMTQGVASLNVSVATGICLYEIIRQRK